MTDLVEFELALHKNDLVRMKWSKMTGEFAFRIHTLKKFELVYQDVVSYHRDAFEEVVRTMGWGNPLAVRKEIDLFRKILKVTATPRTFPSQRIELPPAADKAAFPYQREGIRRAIEEMNGRLLLADEMGLGKSLQSLSVAHHYMKGNDKRLLICCPSSLVDNWTREVKKWLGDEFTMQKVSTDKTVIEDAARIVVVSYGLVGLKTREVYKRLSTVRWGVILIDESHSLKDNDTQRSQCISPMLTSAERCVLISGTPILARPSELFVQFRSIFNAEFPELDWFDYTKRWCAGHTHPFYRDHYGRPLWDVSGASNTHELFSVLATRMIRRRQRVVLGELPPKTRVMTHLGVSSHDLADYARLKKERDEVVRRFASMRDDCPDKNALAFDLRLKKSELWRKTGLAKINAACQFIDEAIASESGKILIFAHHENVRNALAEHLTSKNVKFVTIAGNTPVNKRQSIVDRVADPDSDVKVCIASITAACTGLNFCPGTLRIIFVEMVFTPSIHLQAECRAHRLGCVKPIRVDYLIAKGTLDDELFAINGGKFRTNDRVIDDGTDSKGFKVDSMDERQFAGYQLEPYGVQNGAESVKVLPNEKESLENYIKRACVCTEFEEDDLNLNDPSYFATNEINNNKRCNFKNLLEWALPALPKWDKKRTYHLLDAEVSEIEKIKRMGTNYERREAMERYRTCAIYVSVSG